jgi:uncharacterized protein YbjT (DUF2867 family)
LPKKGAFGDAILTKLLEGGFQVTILTRSKPSVKDIPANVQVIEVDYNSVDDLIVALKGQDAVVATLPGAGAALQPALIDAAIKAGVKHFIPSDFGMISVNPNTRKLPLAASMVQIQDYLKAKAANDEINYSIIACGAMLDWITNTPMLLDFKSHHAPIYDGGNAAFSVSTYATIADAITAVFRDPETWKNKIVYIYDGSLSQNQIFEMAKKANPNVEWTESQVDTVPLMKAGMEAMARGEFGMDNIGKILTHVIFSGTYEMTFEANDMQNLGVGNKSDEELAKMIGGAVQL